MDAWQQAAEIDAYWEREASKAYAERRATVRKTLRENGWREERWMQFQITRNDLDAELVGRTLGNGEK